MLLLNCWCCASASVIAVRPSPPPASLTFVSHHRSHQAFFWDQGRSSMRETLREGRRRGTRLSRAAWNIRAPRAVYVVSAKGEVCYEVCSFFWSWGSLS